MRAATLLEARDLVRRYVMRRGLLGRSVPVTAVAGLSLTLHRGRTLGLVGESGCGKSTTGRMVLGLEMPDAGSVAFEGRPMPPPGTAAWRALRARMQMVFQDPLGALDRRMTVAAQVAEPLDIHGVGGAAERADRVEALLRNVGLRPDQGARYPHELSGGQRQRVVLARALATSPAMLVCDEPISALDVSIQAQVMNLLVELQAEHGMALLFISHDLRAVRQVSERVAVMYLGTIVEEGEPDALLRDARHPYTQALVSAIPHPGRSDGRIVLQGDPPNPAARPSGCPFHPRCPVAVARCAQEAPVLRDHPGGRRVACHLADPAAFAEAA
ncbi:ATP-binding cassette domain-containing protein [Roseomonas eburnea]|uniref:ATP-binding cassette domain-containing protein n=1 Tax=Neoroseomonas eburnea TaxID=1346889 RepID=A0A9X9X9J1_9PROT|nr:oligopeptide/dipeptide ABC transporter ATP-binding protein [Neoroseomonas eburnea]MBR0680377.1 ATP-binding cassette domain-containing protein [Neoroseomonas eburnea]